MKFEDNVAKGLLFAVIVIVALLRAHHILYPSFDGPYRYSLFPYQAQKSCFTL